MLHHLDHAFVRDPYHVAGLTCVDRGRIAGNLRPQQPNAVEALAPALLPTVSCTKRVVRWLGRWNAGALCASGDTASILVRHHHEAFSPDGHGSIQYILSPAVLSAARAEQLSSLREPRVTPEPLAEPEEEIRCEIEISYPSVLRYRSHGIAMLLASLTEGHHRKRYEAEQRARPLVVQS